MIYSSNILSSFWAPRLTMTFLFQAFHPFFFICSFLFVHGHTGNNQMHLFNTVSHFRVPPKTSSGPMVFNVLSFNAVGDCVSDDTQAFMIAWHTACQNTHPSVVIVPKGYCFILKPSIFTGPCRNSLVFKIDGTIVAPDGPDSWPQDSSKQRWLVFNRTDQMSFEGQGVIDGRGNKWWNLPCKPPPQGSQEGITISSTCDSPAAIRFLMSSNLTIQGLTIKNSPQFHVRLDNCENVKVDSLHINSPAQSPNTDGIHIENTSNVQIYNSVIANGDDCISIGAGSFNVEIRNITCGPSHGISIGSLGEHNIRAHVSNVTVADSFIKSSENGVRIKTWQGGSGSVSNIIFNNIQLDAVRNSIIIDQYYCRSNFCTNQTSAVQISDIWYTNIKGTYDVRSPPIYLACSDSVPCKDIVMFDIELFPAQGKIVADPFCWNAYLITPTTLTNPPGKCLLGKIPQLVSPGR